MNELNKVGKSLGKDARDTKVNSGRIAKNLPYVERKLDIVTADSSYKLKMPIKRTESALLNIYIKPDNCCECVFQPFAGSRGAYGDITYYENFILDTSNPPIESGVEYRGIVENITTKGVIDSPWFAYPGYPFFYPDGTYDDYWNQHTFGDFYLNEGGIAAPVDGVYIVKYYFYMSGVTTYDSKITASIKRKHLGEWIDISKKVYSVSSGTICWYENEEQICAKFGGDGQTFSATAHIQAICCQINSGDIISGWIKADNVVNFDPTASGRIEVTLMGLGYGVLTGYVRDMNTNAPIENASVVTNYSGQVETTDETGRYTFYQIASGPLDITASKAGYNSATVTTTIIFNEIVHQDFGLVHV